VSRAAAIRKHVLDWKFLAALAFLIMVTYLVVGGYTEQVAKGRRIDALIAQGRAKDQAADQAATAASKERDRLLANQERLLRLVRQQNRRQAAFGKYLKDAGVTLNIPDSLKAPSDSPQANKNSGRRPHAGGASSVPSEQNPKPGQPGGPSPPPGRPAPQPNPVQDLLDKLRGQVP